MNFLRWCLCLLCLFLSVSARHLLLMFNSDTENPLRLPPQEQLQSLVSQMSQQIAQSGTHAVQAHQVRKQIFSRKFWKR